MMALHNYTARSDKEISLKKGDIVTLISREAKHGWWKGSVNGKIGKFPSNYCVFIELETAQPSQPVTTQTSPPRRTITEKPVVKVITLFPFTKRKEGEISFGKGETITVLKQNKSGWWKGQLKNEIGLFPFNYCKVIEE